MYPSFLYFPFTQTAEYKLFFSFIAIQSLLYFFIILKFNNSKILSISVVEKEIACGFIAEVLKGITNLNDYEIKSTNYYIDTFVIRL